MQTANLRYRSTSIKIGRQPQNGAVLVIVTIVSFILASLMVGTSLQSTYKQLQIIEGQNKVASFEAGQSCMDITIDGLKKSNISPDPLSAAVKLNGNSYHSIPGSYFNNKLCASSPCKITCSVGLIYLTDMKVGTRMALDSDETSEVPVGARFKIRSTGQFKEASNTWNTVIYRGFEVP